MRDVMDILVVDDMEINRVILREMFQGDYNILEADNGRTAMDLVHKHHDTMAIILLDVMMPVMDGIAMLEALNHCQYMSRIPVILITAESDDNTALKGYSLGVSDIITKPFSPEIVMRRVSNVIELYNNKRNLEEKLEEQARKLKKTNAFVTDTLSTVIEFRNGESGSHIRRIRRITKLLLEALTSRYERYHFTKEEISMICDASALHDIGKIAIPDSVLLKPGKLTKEEFEVMKTHTLRGCEILHNLDYVQDEKFYNYCYDICRHHHERWDGRGYPDGLNGDAISIWAQVVSLADVYEALTNKRVYKPAYTHDQAVSMILNGECGAFNPHLLECFLESAELLAADVPELEGNQKENQMEN